MLKVVSLKIFSETTSPGVKIFIYAYIKFNYCQSPLLRQLKVAHLLGQSFKKHLIVTALFN